MFVLMAVVLFGCNKAPQVSATPTPASTKIIQNTNDSNAPISRLELTDPALFHYLNQGGTVSGTSNNSANLDSGAKKLNKLVAISEDRTNGIKGSAQIINTQNIFVIKVSGFSYNGKCGQISLGLAVNGLPKQPIYKFDPITTAQDNTQFDLQIPPNIDLIQFNSLNIYCPNSSSPVSITQF